MPLATTQGKEAALQALAARREVNKTKKHVDNSRLQAGDWMYFDCLACNGEIRVPESYISRPMLCEECQALKDCGWLE